MNGSTAGACDTFGLTEWRLTCEKTPVLGRNVRAPIGPGCKAIWHRRREIVPSSCGLRHHIQILSQAEEINMQIRSGAAAAVALGLLGLDAAYVLGHAAPLSTDWLGTVSLAGLVVGALLWLRHDWIDGNRLRVLGAVAMIGSLLLALTLTRTLFESSFTTFAERRAVDAILAATIVPALLAILLLPRLQSARSRVGVVAAALMMGAPAGAYIWMGGWSGAVFIAAVGIAVLAYACVSISLAPTRNAQIG